MIHRLRDLMFAGSAGSFAAAALVACVCVGRLGEPDRRCKHRDERDPNRGEKEPFHSAISSSLMDNSSSECASWSERRRNRRVRSSCGRSRTSAGSALLDDLPLVHEDQAVAHLACELHLVRDDEHRHARLARARA